MTQSPNRAPVPIVALDFARLDQGLALVDELGPLCRLYKVGSQLFTAEGPAAVSEIRARGCEVMLDLKFHDIPNTVAGAVASAGSLGVGILTVHATGGEAMIRAAVAAAGPDCRVFAVTVLTSLDGPGASAVWGREPVDMSREVVRLGTLARDAGAAGVVASGSEVEAIKAALGEGFRVLVPGVRLAGTGAGDQRRVVTPAAARRLGADYVVLGRTVSAATGRRDAMQRVLEELESHLD
ncbi:MAG: orotidine-5'-phosphate decarboxylase [Gemmatimonadaceae bacterium]